ncbi:MAG: Mor transcription activator family protein [Firmicutes bacterium ADurb.Bin193]|nr:MAG: Mor transcription activator family protein [Firmicutes bacterium ADurb.Bin193]
MEYNMDAILAEVTPQELPPPYSDIARAVNMETALRLAQLYQGTHLYFPKLDEVLRTKRNERIKKEFNGYNLKELAIKYNVTDRWIRELVGEAEDENQLGIDNYL